MPPHKRDRQDLETELALSAAVTTILLLTVLIAVKGSQNVIIAFSTAVMAVLAILQFVRDVSG
jgi:hypothetical protein